MKLHWLVTLLCAGLAAAAEPPARAELPDRLRQWVSEVPGEMPGRVTDPDGRPIAGATVRLRGQGLGADAPDLANAVSDADGRFVLDRRFRLTVPENRIWAHLLVYHPDWALWVRVVHQVPPEFAVTVEPGREVTLRLRADRSPVGARVVPIRSDLVGLPKDLQDALAVVADEAGRCSFAHWPSGGLSIQLEDRRFARWSPALGLAVDGQGVATITRNRGVLDREDDDDGLVLELEPGASVRTQVVSGETGQPVAGVRVFAQGVGDHHGFGEAVTDADGRAEILQLSAGTYNLLVDLDEEMQAEWTAAAWPNLPLRRGEILALSPFRLVRGAVVRGRVTAPEGRALPALMDVCVYGPSRPRSGAATDSRLIDEEGRFSFRVPPGLNYLYIRDETGEGQPVPDPIEVELVEGEQIELEFALGANPPLRGLVLAPDGAPAAGAQLLLVSQGNSVSLAGRTNDEGEFELSSRYFNQRFELWAHRGSAGTVEPVRYRPGDDPVFELVMEPNAAAMVEGLAFWPDQQPAGRCQLILDGLIDGVWTQVGNGTVGRNGQYWMTCPPIATAFRVSVHDFQLAGRMREWRSQPFRATPGEVVELPIWTLTEESEWVR